MIFVVVVDVVCDQFCGYFVIILVVMAVGIVLREKCGTRFVVVVVVVAVVVFVVHVFFSLLLLLSADHTTN